MDAKGCVAAGITGNTAEQGFFFAREDHAEASPAQPTHCVLTVESDPSMAQLITRVLTRSGYRMMLALSGADALEIARREAVDVIVLDLWVTDMDGFDLLARLVALQGPRVVVFTDAHQGWEEWAHRLGAAGFVDKDQPPRRLLEVVEQTAGRER
ncbi:MAG: response regulator [Dehalococcoidia bacterium]